MNTVLRRWTGRALAFLLLTVLSACTVTGRGYVGGVYEPYDYDYGGWGTGYYVGPPRGGQRRPPQPTRHAYRPAPQTRPAPSIPTHPRGH